MSDYAYRQYQAKTIISGFEEPLKTELKSIFDESGWDMLTIANTYFQLKSTKSLRIILKAASQTGIHPQQICYAIGK